MIIMGRDDEIALRIQEAMKPKKAVKDKQPKAPKRKKR